MSPEIAARLARLRIELMADAKEYSVFARDGCMALAQRAGDGGFISVGSSGVATEHGLAYLVWREGRPVLAAHGGQESAAADGQVEAIRQFSRDLKAALGLDQ